MSGRPLPFSSGGGGSGGEERSEENESEFPSLHLPYDSLSAPYVSPIFPADQSSNINATQYVYGLRRKAKRIRNHSLPFYTLFYTSSDVL